VLLFVSAAYAEQMYVPVFYASYPLAFVTLEEQKGLLESSSIRVKATEFIRKNPGDFDVQVREDEPLPEVLERIVPIMARSSILPELMLVVVVKVESINRFSLRTRRPLKDQFEDTPVTVSPGDIVLLTPRD
jgi:hypothetical protein